MRLHCTAAWSRPCGRALFAHCGPQCGPWRGGSRRRSVSFGTGPSSGPSGSPRLRLVAFVSSPPAWRPVCRAPRLPSPRQSSAPTSVVRRPGFGLQGGRGCAPLWRCGPSGPSAPVGVCPSPPLSPLRLLPRLPVVGGFSPASPPPLHPPLGDCGEREASGFGAPAPALRAPPCDWGCFRCPFRRGFILTAASRLPSGARSAALTLPFMGVDKRRKRQFANWCLTFSPFYGTLSVRSPFRSFGGCPKRVSMDGRKPLDRKIRRLFSLPCLSSQTRQNNRSDFPEVNRFSGTSERFSAE